MDALGRVQGYGRKVAPTAATRSSAGHSLATSFVRARRRRLAAGGSPPSASALGGPGTVAASGRARYRRRPTPRHSGQTAMADGVRCGARATSRPLVRARRARRRGERAVAQLLVQRRGRRPGARRPRRASSRSCSAWPARDGPSAGKRGKAPAPMAWRAWHHVEVILGAVRPMSCASRCHLRREDQIDLSDRVAPRGARGPRSVSMPTSAGEALSSQIGQASMEGRVRATPTKMVPCSFAVQAPM